MFETLNRVMNVELLRLIEKIKDSSVTLYILCGLPYAGKTYVSREIIAATNCVYVSIDVILERLGYDWESDALPDSVGWEKVFRLSYEETAQALRSGRSVLYDSTNHTMISRNALRQVASESATSSCVVFIDVSPQVVRERWEENKRTHQRFVLSKELLEQTIQTLEKPTAEENVIVIQN